MGDSPRMPYTKEQRSKRKKGAKLTEIAYNKYKNSERNYLKLLYHVLLDAEYNHNISQKQLMMLFYCYDLEFFTLSYAQKNYNITSKKHDFYKRIFQPLHKAGLIYKYFEEQQAGLPKEIQSNYEARWALTNRARNIVTAYYKKIEGRMPIFIDRDRFEIVHGKVE
jgi:hypothetical protein